MKRSLSIRSPRAVSFTLATLAALGALTTAEVARAQCCPGYCGATCPSECACDGADHCVAPWLGLVSADASTDGAAESDGPHVASGDDDASADDSSTADASRDDRADGGPATPEKGDQGGCSCQVLGRGAGTSDVAGWMTASMLAGIALVRGRARKR